MAWYDTGTVSVTNGSTAVVGSGTDFISAKVQVGEAFYGPDGKIYEIAAIVSSTSLTLADNYLGTTQSGQTYKIVPTQSLVADLATNVSTLITDFANVRDIAGEGKFDDGTVAAPGITFNLDQDNGLYRIGANNWAMAVGGSKIVDLTSTGIDVTGTVTADGLTVDGSPVRFVNTAPMLNFMESGVTDSNHRLRQNAGNFVIQKLSDDEGTATDRFLIDGGTGDISFYEDTGTTAKFFWDASAESLGIGTALPGVRLHVEGATNSNVMIVDNIGTAPNYIFDVRDDGVSKFRVDPSGNVGIGESLPDTLLHLTGDNPKLTFEDSGAYAADSVTSTILFNGKDAAGNNRTLAYIEAKQHAGANGTGSLDFKTRIAGVEASRLTIDSSGRVGINRTPSISNSKLEVGGADDVPLINVEASGVTGGMGIGSTGLQFFHGSSAHMRIDSSGNLIFKGNDLDLNNGTVLHRITNSGTDLLIRADYNNALANSTIQFSVDGSEAMRIDSSGHVIIPAGVTLGTAVGTYNAANTLDDYEEGTWTATSAVTLTANTTPSYTKIGRLVHLVFDLTVATTSSSSDFLINIPFAGVVGQYGTGTINYNSSGSALGPINIDGNTGIKIRNANQSVNLLFSELSGVRIIGSVTYETSA